MTISAVTCIFPDSLKTAKVIPTHKKDEKTIMPNYRPICYITCVVQNNRKCYALATNALF